MFFTIVFKKGEIIMTNLQNQINNYLEYCQNQKRLDSKTLKAYQIDLRQFQFKISTIKMDEITSKTIEIS